MIDDLTIRALIIDDDIDSRDKVRTLLASNPDVEIIGECASGHEAVAAIKEHVPELVFLDVELLDMTGYEVLDQIEKDLRPLVIFVTGHPEYAVQGHNVEALHFLVKPLAQRFFDDALRRVRDRLVIVRERKRQNEHLLIRDKPGVYPLVLKSNICWVQADEKYMYVHVNSKAYHHRMPIGALESELDPNRFVRIHRKYIVNIYYIKELHHFSKDNYKVVLKDGIQLDVSEAGYKKLRARGLAPSRS